MLTEAFRTHRIAVNDSLEKILDQYILDLAEGNIIAITSKIISLCQGRVISKAIYPKKALIRQEADVFFETEHNPYNIYLTIKEGILIPSAGIDESNIDQDNYVLYPLQIQNTAAMLWQYLRRQHGIKKLGIIITDSHTTMMRRGVTGIALGWCGFAPLYSYINKPDIHGNFLRVTQINIIDALAVSAVYVMGEGDEQTPLARIKNAPKITFQSQPPTPEEEKSIKIPLEEDLYAPLLSAFQK